MNLRTDHCPRIQVLESVVTDFCNSVIFGKRVTLTLVGDTGTAKTHCLKKAYRAFQGYSIPAWSKGWWSHPPMVTFAVWSDIAVEDKSDSDLFFEESMDCDILILDDIGSEIDRYKTNDPKERLRKLLSAREKKSTLVSTNVPASRWSEVWDVRVEDRLYRNGALVFEMNGIPRFSEVT